MNRSFTRFVHHFVFINIILTELVIFGHRVGNIGVAIVCQFCCLFVEKKNTVTEKLSDLDSHFVATYLTFELLDISVM